MNGDNVTFFDSFGVEYIPKEGKKTIGNKNVATNTYRKQVRNSVTCGYFYIGFIGFMLRVKNLTDYANSFSPNEYEKNIKIIRKYFQ